jgi:hypothetical protein
MQAMPWGNAMLKPDRGGSAALCLLACHGNMRLLYIHAHLPSSLFLLLTYHFVTPVKIEEEVTYKGNYKAKITADSNTVRRLDLIYAWVAHHLFMHACYCIHGLCQPVCLLSGSHCQCTGSDDDPGHLRIGRLSSPLHTLCAVPDPVLTLLPMRQQPAQKARGASLALNAKLGKPWATSVGLNFSRFGGPVLK